MVAEAALCLALDKQSCPQTFGVLTPSTAFGDVLIQRLEKRGINFTLE